jgi:hypothetical protein
MMTEAAFTRNARMISLASNRVNHTFGPELAKPVKLCHTVHAMAQRSFVTLSYRGYGPRDGGLRYASASSLHPPAALLVRAPNIQ